MSTDMQQITQQVHTVVNHADDQLSRISNRLEDEYSYLYHSSTSHTNPYNLLTRLRKLELQFDQVLQKSFDCHQRRLQLVHLCQNDIRESLTFAQRAQAYLSSSSPSPEYANETLLQLDQQLRDMVNKFPSANKIFLQTLLMKNGLSEEEAKNAINTNLQISSVSSSLTPSTLTTAATNVDQGDNNDIIDGSNLVAAGSSEFEEYEATESLHHDDEEVSLVQEEPASVKAAVPMKRVIKTRKKVAAPTASKSKDLSSTSPFSSRSGGASSKAETTLKTFEPVSKAAFNRLPRNLKIGAGKLADVNAFYETVFNVLVDHTDGMLEKQLLKMIGEEDAKRLGVLRGLSVLRVAEGKWRLNARK